MMCLGILAGKGTLVISSCQFTRRRLVDRPSSHVSELWVHMWHRGYGFLVLAISASIVVPRVKVLLSPLEIDTEKKIKAFPMAFKLYIKHTVAEIFL